jgi:hypothetical protein
MEWLKEGHVDGEIKGKLRRYSLDFRTSRYSIELAPKTWFESAAGALI